MDSAGEILKSGALTNLTDLVKKLAGPASEEIGAILADKVRVYRIKNVLKTAEKTREILEAAGLEARPIASRLLLPILDTCSVEDDDDLQNRWAGLLVSASQDSASISPSFVETLKQLTPNEAKHLDLVLDKLSSLYLHLPTHEDPIPHQAFSEGWGAPAGALETFERLGLIERVYDIKLDKGTSWNTAINLHEMRPRVNEIESAIDELRVKFLWDYAFTAYALKFLAACRGPGKKKSDLP